MKILVTAGPTREAIDPVRYISNRSSGKMGFALAGAASAMGHEVILVAGPCELRTPEGVRRLDVVTAGAMYEAVLGEIGEVDAAIFSAAVADYRPVAISEEKIKKAGERMILEMERTRDILGSARGEMGFEGVLVGFAAETEDMEANARRKMEQKGCDFLVANDVSREDIGFDVEENEVTVYFVDGREERPGKMGKAGLARILIGYVEKAVSE
ncbi:MAG: phosphopantothenoylcysteine decarboxylase [Verrucomicrobiota bacterium]